MYSYDRSHKVAGNDLDESELSSVRSPAYEFFLRVEKIWNSATFTSHRNEGSVKWPGLGLIKFRDATSGDSAVVIDWSSTIFMKARPEQVVKALEKIHKIVGNTAL